MTNPGGFWRRFFSLFLDGLLISAIVSAAIFIFGLDTSDRTVQAGEGIASLLYFVLVPVFWYGYTVGKKILGVRIVKIDNTNVTLLTMILRYIVGGLIYAFSFGIAFIVSVFMVALRKDKRSVHDFVAGTYVTQNTPETNGKDFQ
ncbi:MAG: RDD family protein [Alkalicoccus sp.]|nr:MAG: RDD family protein [Alkalicoccus sp.]